MAKLFEHFQGVNDLYPEGVNDLEKGQCTWGGGQSYQVGLCVELDTRLNNDFNRAFRSSFCPKNSTFR